MRTSKIPKGAEVVRTYERMKNTWKLSFRDVTTYSWW